jgi:flagellar P-ring protein precursor FlgI
MNYFLTSLIFAVLLCLPRVTCAEITLSDVCRIKGQEENTLHGMGLVVGLKGTGDGDSKTTLRALARYMELMGHRVGNDARGQLMIDELKGVRNVALVFVTVTIPAGGAQQGDLLDCKVSAVSAKSLEGGYLMLTELHGPVPGDRTVYGIAKGPVSIDDIIKPQTGTITGGCQVEQKFQNEFVKDGKLLLVMNKDHATFQMASLVEQSINREPDFRLGSTGEGIARALDQVRVQVTIPPTYADNPALFASVLMDTRVGRPQTDTTVIINERKQAVIVGADVEIGPVAVMHKNRLIQVGGEQINQFVEVNPSADTQKPKLTALVDALNTLKVPAEDVIDIIKMLKHKRALYGELIIE